MRPTTPFPSPPLWRESRVGLEAARLLRDPIFSGDGVPDGRGQPVLLIPGLFAGDGSLAVMARWLRKTGHHTRKAGIRVNVDCSGRSTDRLEECLEQLVERQGKRAAIIGQSRGGSFAKVLAHRRPDLVTGIITLGTPQLEPLAVHPLVRLEIEAIAALGSLKLPRLFSRGCIDGDCCAEFWELLASPLSPEIGHLSIYSRTDGIVDWKACLDPDAELLEIESSHCGMGLNPDAYRAIGSVLDDYRRRAARRGQAAPRRAQFRRAA